jgi:hypothetical protein
LRISKKPGGTKISPKLLDALNTTIVCAKRATLYKPDDFGAFLTKIKRLAGDSTSTSMKQKSMAGDY